MKGSIIPMQEPIEYIGQKPIETLDLKIFLGNLGTSTSITVYEDDGSSMDYANKDLYCILSIQCQYKAGSCSLSLSPLQGDYTPSWKKIKYELFAKGEKKKEDTIPFDKNAKEINISF